MSESESNSLAVSTVWCFARRSYLANINVCESFYIRLQKPVSTKKPTLEVRGLSRLQPRHTRPEQSVVNRYGCYTVIFKERMEQTAIKSPESTVGTPPSYWTHRRSQHNLNIGHPLEIARTKSDLTVCSILRNAGTSVFQSTSTMTEAALTTSNASRSSANPTPQKSFPHNDPATVRRSNAVATTAQQSRKNNPTSQIIRRTAP